MRTYYLSYVGKKKLQTLSAEIGWSHNVLILENCKKKKEIEFYMTLTKKYGLSYRVLMNKLQNNDYELYLNNQTNFNNTLEKKYQKQAKLAVKDKYTFGFLEFDGKYSESKLEKELTKNIRAFLVEMGGDFSFIGQQYRLQVDEEEFFIDLLFFHRDLNRLVAIELKTGKFKPEYSGKMTFYLSVLEETTTKKHENPPIGIIICKRKDRNIVRYALKDIQKPMGVATYTLKKRNSLPSAVARLLPSEKKLHESLAKIVTHN